MTFMPRTPPPPTEGAVGDLLADLPSKTIWLRVSAAEDPSGAVLMSDIEAIATAIDDSLAQANTYTDNAVALRAPLASPHFTGTPLAPTPSAGNSSTSIATTAFVQAAIAAAASSGYDIGTILLYAGSLANIGVGKWVDWHLCNGAQFLQSAYPALFAEIGMSWSPAGTPSGYFRLPDLRDKFLVGAGNVATGTLVIGADQTTDVKGGHSHGGTGGTVLSIAHLPSHSHGVGTYDVTVDAGGAHTHTYNTANNQNTFGAAQLAGTWWSGGAGPVLTSSAGSHTHTGSITGASAAVGSGAAHTHPIVADGSHSHILTALKIKAGLTSAAIAPIIKLK
jgi:hypothetical protein